MRISELSDTTGVALPTLKFYLREGLLMPGIATSATRAEYGDEHVRRVRVIRSLTESAGLSVSKARDVLRIIDAPGDNLFAALGHAVGALPPDPVERDDYPRARRLLERLGYWYDPKYPAVAQFEAALESAESAGMPLSDERLDEYAAGIRRIAEYDIMHVPADGASAVEYSVLGTALYEPVLIALRRLAHQDIAARRLGGLG